MQGQLDWDGVVLPISEVTWANVLATAGRLQGLEINKDFFVTYKDEEGDVVDVKNEIDLDEAISWAKEQQVPCLCLHIPFSSVDSDDESWTEIENSSPRAKEEEPVESRPIVLDRNEEEDANDEAEHFSNEVTKVTLDSQEEDHQTAEEEEVAVDQESEAANEADEDSPDIMNTPPTMKLDDEEPEKVRCEIQAPAIRQVISLHRIDENPLAATEGQEMHPEVVLTPIDEVFQETACNVANDTQVGHDNHPDTQVLGIDEIIQTMCMVNDARVAFDVDDRTFFLEWLSVEENVEKFARLFNNASVRRIVSVVAAAEALHPGSAQKALTTQLIKALYQNPEVLSLLNEIPGLEDALLRVLRCLKSNEAPNAGQDVEAPVEETPAAFPEEVKTRHRLVTCDGCASDDDLLANSLANGCRNEDGEILGIRYKSAVLADYDLCETCEGTGRFDSEAGPFLKIVDPSNAPELILCVMPGATAGMMDQIENLDWRNPIAREFLEFVRSRQQRSFSSARPERTAPPSVVDAPLTEVAALEASSLPCKHMLKRFEAPHGSFKCDVCGGKAPVRAVLHGCRQCNFDMCDTCYSRKGMSLNLPPPPAAPVTTSPPQAKFVSDVTLADGCAVRQGEHLVKTWRVRNSGQDRWPAGTRIAHVGGDAFGGPVEGVEVPLAAPGEAVNVSVPLVMPMLPGRYTSYWRLMTPHPENAKFGHRFWVTVNVLASVPLPTPITHSSRAIATTVSEAQLPGSPAVIVRPQTAAQSAPVVINQTSSDIPAEYVETICRIFDFGFTDVEKVVQALKETNGDAAAAIEKLLEA